MEQGRRCGWCNLKNEVYVRYHDEEWGRAQHDERKLYELLILECFQAGLSWECVLNKRENFRAAFDGFDVERVAAYDEAKKQALMRDGGIIRNRRKIDAAVNNSVVFREIQREFGTFDSYIRSFAGQEVIAEEWTLRTTSPLSDAISNDLKRRGMRFVGSTIVYSFLQAAGVIDGHERGCICRADRGR